jgi:hypothetical protein
VAADVMRLVLKRDPANKPAATIGGLEARNEPPAQKNGRSRA